MIGEAHPRLGGERFVAGAGRFVDDVRVPGMLHAAVLRSPHAHARLVSIDSKRAHDLPGVHAVLTASDVPANAIIPNRVPAPTGTDRYLQPAIARQVVRYMGEPVALVVAADPYVARDALEHMDVVYEPLPTCASTAAALGPGAARLFPGTDSNNVATIVMRVGDADAALAGAAFVLRERFAYPRQTAAALETRGLVAVPPDPRGGVHPGAAGQRLRPAAAARRGSVAGPVGNGLVHAPGPQAARAPALHAPAPGPEPAQRPDGSDLPALRRRAEEVLGAGGETEGQRTGNAKS